MPALIELIPVDLDELLEDRDPAPDALSREPRAVVEVADWKEAETRTSESGTC